jgi:hypothetical protein
MTAVFDLDPGSNAPSPAGTAVASSIPKIIHQVFFPGAPPPVILDNICKIRSLNPGWDYRLYDAPDMASFIRTNYGAGMLSAYHRINQKYGASRADFFRYLLMYKLGGVYLDVKSSIGRPLDEILRKEDTYLLSRWRNGEGEAFEGWGKHAELKQMGGNEFQQWHIIAAPGHPYLQAVIEKVLHNIDTYNPILHDTGINGVLRMTGPIAYTQAITPLLHLNRHRLVDSQEDLGFNYSIFGAPGDRAHKAIFKFHYTELNEPVAELAGTRKLLWTLFGPIQNFLIQPVRGLYEAILRRFAHRQLPRQ